MAHAITSEDVATAQKRLTNGFTRVTPVLTCSSLNTLASLPPCAVQRRLFFKCELFQTTGSFKARGAGNAVFALPQEVAASGVCTHSSGNHAAALAAAARFINVPAYIVMPSNSPEVKKNAVRGYGAVITECAPTEREEACRRVAAETGAVFIHPSEHPAVIAGQGTIALELLQQAEEMGCPLDAIIVPCGGGGMLSGIAVAARALRPGIRIIAAEPAAAADAWRSKQSGVLQGHEGGTPPSTIADGLRTTLGPNTWPIVRDLVNDIVLVSEDEIVTAMRLVYERLKLAIEPSAAVGVAAALGDEVRAMPGGNVGIILCGGNVDLAKLPFA